MGGVKFTIANQNRFVARTFALVSGSGIRFFRVLTDQILPCTSRLSALVFQEALITTHHDNKSKATATTNNSNPLSLALTNDDFQARSEELATALAYKFTLPRSAPTVPPDKLLASYICSIQECCCFLGTYSESAKGDLKHERQKWWRPGRLYYA